FALFGAKLAPKRFEQTHFQLAGWVFGGLGRRRRLLTSERSGHSSIGVVATELAWAGAFGIPSVLSVKQAHLIDPVRLHLDSEVLSIFSSFQMSNRPAIVQRSPAVARPCANQAQKLLSGLGVVNLG